MSFCRFTLHSEAVSDRVMNWSVLEISAGIDWSGRGRMDRAIKDSFGLTESMILPAYHLKALTNMAFPEEGL